MNPPLPSAQQQAGGMREIDMKFYAIYSEDKEYVFGPFNSEEEADEYCWEFSLRNGVEDSYGGSSTEVIDEAEYRKRFQDSQRGNRSKAKSKK